MRAAVTADRIREFMRALGTRSNAEGRVYLTGGASAVLLHWRESTLDVDLKIIPDVDQILSAIPELKERLDINVELASPADFIPELSGWRDRSPFIVRDAKLSFHHYDFYSQCLAKIERGHRKDMADVSSMIGCDLVDRPKLLALFEEIEPQLYRYPAIDPPSFRRAVLFTLNLQ